MLPVDAARAAEIHSNVLNVLLPASYTGDLDEESREGLQLAIEGLRAATAQGDLSRGANFYCYEIEDSGG